jgi:hypothetical protein
MPDTKELALFASSALFVVPLLAGATFLSWMRRGGRMSR